jgi:hypothetical protein
MLFKPFGSVTLRSARQLRNTPTPIVVTLFGIMMFMILELKKAESPILVTPFGMVREVRLIQSAKALLPMLVTPLGMLTLASAVQ